MKLESGKGKRVRKTLKAWGSHYYNIHTDILLGQTDLVNNGKSGVIVTQTIHDNYWLLTLFPMGVGGLGV